MGEWFALPLIEHAGSKMIGDAAFDEIFHPITRGLGNSVYFSISDVPAP